VGELPEILPAPVARDSNNPSATKLGGKPDWIQTEWQPRHCGQPMTFLGQFDSLDIPQAGLPDSALVYVFFCAQCFAVDAQLQCC